MKLHKKILIITSFLLILSVFINADVNKTYAWGPTTHMYMTWSQALNQTDSTITRIIKNNFDWFSCGLMYPDVSVIYYYTNFTSYRSTHNIAQFYAGLWNDAIKRNSEQAKAFTLGVGTHMIQDSVVHNSYIPTKIRTSLVRNNIIHPVIEGIIEGRLASDYKESKALAEDAFARWDDPFTDSGMDGMTPVQWADSILKLSGASSFQDEASTFENILLGGNFKLSFMGYAFISQKGGLWDIFRGVGDIVKVFIPYEESKSYIDESISVTVQWYATGDGSADSLGQYVKGDPSGENALAQADVFVTNWTIVILIIFSIIMIYYFHRKSKTGLPLLKKIVSKED